MVRELLGSGKIFGMEAIPSDYGALVFILAPGAFIVLGFIIGIKNSIDRRSKANAEKRAAKESLESAN